jgi:hypothetical protein
MHRQQVERLSEAGQCLNDGYPEPFVWTADPDNLIAAARRGYQNVRFDPLVTFRRKIEVVGVVVNSARQGKTRRG